MRCCSRIVHFLSAAIFVLSVTALNSCQDTVPVPNEAKLAQDTVLYSNTGQFLSIVSECEWSITAYSTSELTSVCEWITITPSSGTGSKVNVMISHSVNLEDSYREAYIIISFSDETSLTKRLVQMGNTESGGSGGGGDTPSDLVSDSVREWMELPSVTTTQKTAFISHHTTINNKEVRNYSMLYDGENKLALWVAYPLCSAYIGSQDRTNAWGYDPKIPASMQPVIFRAYGANGYEGYDRGHQIPSASRTATYATNAATFYFSNMTAQNSSLNQGIWAKLETLVRGYTSTCDTLYVVTGAVVKTDQDQTITYIKDNNGNNVAIPKGYFKVLMKYVKSSGTYSCIAFWFDNKSYSDVTPSSSNAQTLGWIEQKTGFSFFENLPADVKSSLINTFKPSEWGL